jgi:solute carrier family 13 (sodium-dependent dicarboxylate transporter), member 2/3/5
MESLVMTEVNTLKEPVNIRSMVLKVVIALALGIGIMLLPRPENLPPEGQRLLGLLVSIVFLWVSEGVPIGTTALISAAGLILLQIQPAQNAWAPFASPAVMFVLMVIMFGVVLNEVGLANRLMFYLIRFAGTRIKRLSLILAIGCTLTSTIFHDATITVIMVFAFVPVFMSMGMRPGQGHKLPMFFLLLIPLAASAGGFGTLLGGGRCPLALEILSKYTEGKVSIGFLQYIVIQFPISILTAVTTWAVLWALIRPQEKELAGVELSKPGPMSNAEKGVLTIFIITFTLWFMGDLTHWHYSVPAAFALLGFCAPGWVSFKTVCDKFPWESWLVFGAGVSLGNTMLDSGAGRFLAETFLPLLDGQPMFVVYYGMGFFGSFLSSMMSNSAAVALMLPIMLPMAEMMQMSPEAVAMIAPISTSFIMLVIGCPPTIIAYSTGYFTQKQFIKVAVIWALALLLVSVLSMLVYWPLIGFVE